MRDFPKSEGKGALQPGNWRKWVNDEIMVACPRCGSTRLYEYSEVSLEGFLDRIYRCYLTGCGFQDEIHLMDWKKHL